MFARCSTMVRDFRSLQVLPFFTVALLSAMLSGCASYSGRVDETRGLLVSNPEQAVSKLELLAKEEGKDQLMHMLDYATALQVADRNAESAKAFTAAERIADRKDYHSVSRIATSLALSEEMVQYKGDDFEHVLINGMNSINFLALGELDGALVEVRRVNEKLNKLKLDGKKEFNQSPFAFYLGAILWEADLKFDDAYISYADAYNVAPSFRPLREDLVRSSIQAQRPEETEKWKKMFPEVQVKPEWRDRNRGEIVFVFQNGWGPRKWPRPEAPRFPQLLPVVNLVTSAVMTVWPNGAKEGSQPVHAPIQTTPLYVISDVAVKALEADYSRLVASRVAGVVAKAVLADQLRQRDQLLGSVAWLAMNLSDRADLRQWSTLPHSFQVARVPVKAGKYTVDLRAIGSSATKAEEVEVKPGRKAFVVWRVIQ
jgi:tetratricopeptide (TPR) repeat protein